MPFNKLFPLILPLFAFLLAACPQDKEDECICIEIFDPVCGDDGVQYDNSCFAECAGVAYTDGYCPVMNTGFIRFLGDPAVDGCGYVLELQRGDVIQHFRPVPLDAAFEEDGLEVRVTYRPTMQTDVCGLGGTIGIVEIIEMDRF